MSDHLIVIPVFDEAATIADVVSRARQHGAVLVVDDGSADGTGSMAATAGADVIRLTRRHGKGAALGAGFAEAIARGVERVVTLDGDGQHDPEDIPQLLAASHAAPGALVVGRRLPRPGEPPHPGAPEIPRERLNALRVAGFFIDALTGARLADTQSGFRVYPTALLREVGSLRGGFVLETEVLVRAAARGRPLLDVPIRALPLSGRRSRFRPVADGVAVGRYLAGRVLGVLAREAIWYARELPAPFRGDRRRARHREMAAATAGFRSNPAQFAAAVGLFALARLSETVRAWRGHPDNRRLGALALGVAASPALLALALSARPLGWLGVDLLTPFIARLYSPERLASMRPAPPPASAAVPPRGGRPWETSSRP